MTEAAPLPTDDAARQLSTSAPFKYYHQYCFHLSPTFNRYCPMRVCDLLRLDQFDAFEGQNIFFHMNHPIKWVRVSGVVVNFADYQGRHVYMIDDGTGTAIECVMPAAKTQTAAEIAADRLQRQDPHKKAKDLPEDKVGKVIEARGDLYLYQSQHRGSFLQVQITKLKVLRGTQQEIDFWHKVNTFARETLDRPWVVDKQIVRACRKAAHELKEEAERKKPKRSMARAKASSSTASQAASLAADATPLPPPRRPRKKWQLRPDTPDGIDAEDMHNKGESASIDHDTAEHEPEPEPEPMELDEQPRQRELDDVNTVQANAERSPPRAPRKKWNIGYRHPRPQHRISGMPSRP